MYMWKYVKNTNILKMHPKRVSTLKKANKRFSKKEKGKVFESFSTLDMGYRLSKKTFVKKFHDL